MTRTEAIVKRTLLIVTQVFPPEIHPTAIMVRQLGAYLVARGWEVVVAAGYPHHPYGALYPGYRKRLCSREILDGMQVRRTWHVTSPSSSIAVRGSVWVSQALGNWVSAVAAPKADVVLAYGPPLAGPLLAWTAALRHRAGFVNVVYDIYPDVAVETGKVSNPAFIAAARWAEKLQYLAADSTVVLSSGFRRSLLARGVPPERVEIVPVWLDPDEIKRMPRENAWRRENGIGPEKFVALYAGTVGIVSGAILMADVAAQLVDEKDFLLLVVGDGRAKEELQAECARRGLRNVSFLPFQPRARVPEVLATADVAVVTLAPGRGRTSVPSKVVAYMAAGRPVVASVDDDSDPAAAVRETACGIVTPPGDAPTLVAAIRELRRNDERRAAMGDRSRAGFERTFAMPACLERFREILECVVRK